jgi:hypothetical protein
MIQIRDIYQLRFGRVDQAVALFSRLPRTAIGPAPLQHHALTDISGSMYTFVSELLVSSLAEWDHIRNDFFDQKGFAEWFREFQLIVQSGRQEFFTVECEHTGWSQPGVVVVREVYHALKWQIRPAVNLLLRYGALLEDNRVGRNCRILTDLSGQMFRAIIEIETPGLSEWEAHRRELYKLPDFQAWFTQLASAVEGGSHEFYRVELVQKPIADEARENSSSSPAS